MVQSSLIIIAGLVFLVLLMLLYAVTRYKRCPSDKILVIYGRTGAGSAKCLAGGAAFVWPVIQDYQFLDLTPISIDVNLRGALSKQNIRVNVPSRFTVAVSNDASIMTNAAERLLGKSRTEIADLSKDIIFGQLRLVVATMDIEEINSDRDKFLSNVTSNVGSELKKIGLALINVNVTDIEDESKYIEALGKEAAAHAINEARVRVAEREREGSIGEAEAKRDQRVKVANAEADAVSGEAEAKKEERVRVAEANARSIEGENRSQVSIAKSDSDRRKKEAEANNQALASEKVEEARALEIAYQAEQKAEKSRADRERASLAADTIVKAEIAKRKAEIDAEAMAETIRRKAKGEADAIYMKKEAEARGMYELLTKQADGFEKIVKASGGGPRDAVLMMIADKLEDLVKTQVDAIKNIKIDKVTVWEGGNQNDGESNSTSKFISGLYKSVPPMNDLFNMAGMDLPGYLGKANKPDEDIIRELPVKAKDENEDEDAKEDEKSKKDDSDSVKKE
ncbi:MAG: flotillin family protein [Saprospirales bacterium]|nr:MAG: flotillin family protein [Saprospirales bacterium]